jgi:hypothetical protein
VCAPICGVLPAFQQFCWSDVSHSFRFLFFPSLLCHFSYLLLWILRLARFSETSPRQVPLVDIVKSHGSLPVGPRTINVFSLPSSFDLSTFLSTFLTDLGKESCANHYGHLGASWCSVAPIDSSVVPYPISLPRDSKPKYILNPSHHHGHPDHRRDRPFARNLPGKPGLFHRSNPSRPAAKAQEPSKVVPGPQPQTV